MVESALSIDPRDRLIGEAARLLAPGGRLVIAEPVLFRELDLRDLRRQREPLAALDALFGEGLVGYSLIAARRS